MTLHPALTTHPLTPTHSTVKNSTPSSPKLPITGLFVLCFGAPPKIGLRDKIVFIFVIKKII
jgi:hypothetical protein